MMRGFLCIALLLLGLEQLEAQPVRDTAWNLSLIHICLHMVNEKLASPVYIYTPYMNVSSEIDATDPVGMVEYWSTEKTSIVGEMMYLDTDPSKCFSMGGKSLAKTVSCLLYTSTMP